MRNLITGGAGFVGSHLTEHLLGRGDEVFILDNLSTGAISNLDGCRDHPKLHYHCGDALGDPILAELVDRCDRIYHLAAAVGVRLIVEDPVHTIETNISGTEAVLGLAVKKKKPVLIASTSEVYGKSSQIPFREDGDMVLGPTSKGRWAYACSKAVDEFLAIAYFKSKGLPTVVVRLFNTVGPRQTGQYGMVIPNFVCQALAGKPITVYGDGKQSRCFGYVGDVAPGLVSLMDTAKCYGQVFNIGNDQEITIEDLAKLVISKVDPSLGIKYIPYSEAYQAEDFEDMQRRVPDLSKIRGAIGYEPKTNVDQIIDNVIAYFREHESERVTV
ncbi:MAG: GDP-mannose 4,6-dehydratase [Planctomycetota bacterium]